MHLVCVRVHNVCIRGGAKKSSTYRGARGISRKVPWNAWSDEAGDWMGAVCLLEEVSRVGLIREVLLDRSRTEHAEHPDRNQKRSFRAAASGSTF